MPCVFSLSLSEIFYPKQYNLHNIINLLDLGEEGREWKKHGPVVLMNSNWEIDVIYVIQNICKYWNYT